MYLLKLEASEVQLIQVCVKQAALNMDQSNLRGQLWMSMQKQLTEQMPSQEVADGVKKAIAGDGEPKDK